MSEEVWQGWWQLIEAKLSEAGCSDFCHGSDLRSSLKKDDFENFVKVELLMPFASAVSEFEKKNFNLLKSINTSTHLSANLQSRLKYSWEHNFKFYWRKIQLEDAQGRPIKQIDGKVDWRSVVSDEEVPSERRDEFEEKIKLLKGVGTRGEYQDSLYYAFHETEKQRNFWLNYSPQLAKMFVAHTSDWVEKGEEEFLPWMEQDREKYWQQAVVVAQEVAAGFAEDLEGVKKRILRDLGGKWWYRVKQFREEALPWVLVVLVVVANFFKEQVVDFFKWLWHLL